MTLAELNPFIRYARIGPVSPLPQTVRTHDARLFYLLEGESSVALDGLLCDMHPGACLLIPPGVPYQFRTYDNAVMIVLNFDYTNRWCDFETCLAPVPDGASFVPRFPREVPENCQQLTKPLYLPSFPRAEAALRELAEEWALRQPYWRGRASALLKDILLLSVRETEAQNDIGSRRVGGQLASYLRTHCVEQLTAEELSAVFGYHPVHLNRLIRQSTGQSLHQYSLHCRIEEARRLLTETELSMEEVSAQLGFSSASYFSACFRRVGGVTPREYRASHSRFI